MFLGFRKPHEAVDFVAHVAEAASLMAVAVDGEGFTAQGLLHEIGDNSSIVQLHTRPVGIEDADNASVYFVITVVGHGYRFGEALGFVVDGTGADAVDVAPIGFLLGVLQGIAVTLGGGRNQVLGPVFMGYFESVKCSEGTDLECGDAVNGVVDGTGRTGKMEDIVDLAHVKGLANIFFDELETRFVSEVGKVGGAAGEEIVDYHHVPALGEQSIAEMRSQKPGAAGNYRAFRGHAFLPFLKSAAGTPSGWEAGRPTL